MAAVLWISVSVANIALMAWTFSRIRRINRRVAAIRRLLD